MRFLFTAIPGSGHFHPLVPTAQALQRRGHDVAFAASPTFAPTIEAAGFEAHPAGFLGANLTVAGHVVAELDGLGRCEGTSFDYVLSVLCFGCTR